MRSPTEGTQTGVALGMPSTRVDGNDFLAMYHATKAARDKILQEGTPVFLDAYTYRLGYNSTNNGDKTHMDILSYTQNDDPIVRCASFMKRHDLLDFDIQEFQADTKKQI